MAACNEDVLAVVDRNRCEAKGPCVEACPRQAIEIRPLPEALKGEMSLVGRLKAWAHGGRQAFIDPDLCAGCGACLPVCPEKALRLVPRPA